MHLALLVMEFPPDPIGGIGAFASELAAGLLSEGHRVTVIVADLGARFGSSNETSEARPQDRLRVVRYAYATPRWMRWRPGLFWHRWRLRCLLRSLHREDRFDLVESQDMYGPLPFGGLRGVPTVLRHHSSLWFYDSETGSSSGDPMTYRLERETVRRAPFHVGVSRYVADGVAELYGLERDRVEVIPCAIDTDLFSPGSADQVRRDEILFVNTVQPRKGAKELCEAFAIVTKEFPQASLTLVGRTGFRLADGTDYVVDCLEGLPEAVTRRIRFLGPRDRISEIVPALQRAYVCCFPSKIETFGIAPLEAMACGKPVVYMNHGPGPEIITDGVDGLLCDTASPEDIAEKLLALLRDEDLAARLGRAARKRALDFSRSAWIDRNLAYYASVLEEGAATRRKQI